VIRLARLRLWPAVDHLTWYEAQRAGIIRPDAVLVTGGARVMSGYLDNSGREDVLSGGARMIPVDTPAGRYRVRMPVEDRYLQLFGGCGYMTEYPIARVRRRPGAD
jgi:hypothetical protein